MTPTELMDWATAIAISGLLLVLMVGGAILLVVCIIGMVRS